MLHIYTYESLHSKMALGRIGKQGHVNVGICTMIEHLRFAVISLLSMVRTVVELMLPLLLLLLLLSLGRLIEPPVLGNKAKKGRIKQEMQHIF